MALAGHSAEVEVEAVFIEHGLILCVDPDTGLAFFQDVEFFDTEFDPDATDRCACCPPGSLDDLGWARTSLTVH